MGCCRISFVEHLLNPGDLVRMPNLKMDEKTQDFLELNCLLLTEMGLLNTLKKKNIYFNPRPFSKTKCTIKDVQDSQKNLVDFHIEVNKKIDGIIDKKEIKEFHPVSKDELEQTLQEIVEIRSPWNRNLEILEFNPEIQREGEWIEQEKNEFNNLLFGEQENRSVETLGRIRIRGKGGKTEKTVNNNGFTKTKKDLEKTKEELEKRKKELEEIERLAKEKEEELKRKAEEKKKKEKQREIERKKREKEEKIKQREIEKQKKLEAKRLLKEQKIKEKQARIEQLKLEKEKKKRLKEKEKQEKIREIEKLKLEKENERLKKLEAERLLKEEKIKEKLAKKEEILKTKEKKKKETREQEKKPIIHFREKAEKSEKTIKDDVKETDSDWDEEVRQAFTIIDNLLENLPDEKIDEFVRSDDFAIYERVVSKYKKKRE